MSAGGGSGAAPAAGGVRRGRGRSRCAAPGTVPCSGQARLLQVPVPAPSCEVERGWAGAPHSHAAPDLDHSPAATEGALCVVFNARCTELSTQCSVQPSSSACDGAAPCPQPWESTSFPTSVALWGSQGCEGLRLLPCNSPKQGLERPQPWGEAAGQRRAGAEVGLGIREGWRPPAKGGPDEAGETQGCLHPLWDTVTAHTAGHRYRTRWRTPTPPGLSQPCPQG